MNHQWMDTGWVSAATRDTLVRALGARRRRAGRSETQSRLGRAFASLCAEARATSQPPEAVLQVFRTAWDAPRPLRPDDDPRDLLYYGTLTECLDACFAPRGRRLAGSAVSGDRSRSAPAGRETH